MIHELYFSDLMLKKNMMKPMGYHPHNHHINTRVKLRTGCDMAIDKWQLLYRQIHRKQRLFMRKIGEILQKRAKAKWFKSDTSNLIDSLKNLIQ